MIDALDAITVQELCELDAQKVLVLTVNNRHARRVLGEFSAALGQDRRVMAVPDIVPFSAWLRRMADQLSFVPGAKLPAHTVDAFGSQLLWQRAIGEVEADRALLDLAQAAKLAADADRMLDDWHIEVPDHCDTLDHQRYQLWREHYRGLLAGMDAEDANLAYQRIHAAVVEGLLLPDVPVLVLAGFNEMSPRLKAMLTALQDQGTQLRSLAQAARPAQQVQRVAAPDPDTEWRYAAQWAADRLSDDPSGRYAIVAARLEADVALAHRCLRAALREDETGQVLPYNVAVARPLVEWPVVRAALAWLHVLSRFVMHAACEPAELGQALLAGHCAGDRPEAGGRAALDAYWRRQAIIKVSGPQLPAQFERYAPRLGAAWRACLSQFPDRGVRVQLSEWASHFRRLLQDLGFPGEGVLDSHAYQALEAFDELLDRLGRLARISGPVGMGAAVGLLRKLARETPFQPQRDPAARLDVLGFLESEGGRWDGVWVLGLTDEILPAVPRPNPFIPLVALRQAQAPRATPERELQWARKLYAALLTCAPNVWLSHAFREGERELRPSPCIVDVPLADYVLRVEMSSPCPMEYLVDEHGPALQPGVSTRGGIAVIDTQARNPLWAFVKYRLGASRLDAYADVSDQNARGLLLHRAAELVWRMLPDQQALVALQQRDGIEPLLQELVAQAADDCLKDYGPTLRKLEVGRAVRILRQWLGVELGRQPFAVRDVEQSYQWEHGPLALTLRLDRIDQLHDGRLAVIDYKTGNGSIDPKPDWMRDRPVGLQLPFYAAVLAEDSEQVAALVLARLHARDLETKGLADADIGLEGLSALSDWPAFEALSWDRLMDQWRRTIRTLADEYAAGVARNYSLRPDDLQYCDVLPFLRLTEEIVRVD